MEFFAETNSFYGTLGTHKNEDEWKAAHNRSLTAIERAKKQLPIATGPDTYEKHGDQWYKVGHRYGKGNAFDVEERLNTFKSKLENEQYPKTWLAKKLAWLRGLYSNWMAQKSIMSAQGKANIFQRIGAFILRLIDRVAQKLQNLVN